MMCANDAQCSQGETYSLSLWYPRHGQSASTLDSASMGGLLPNGTGHWLQNNDSHTGGMPRYVPAGNTGGWDGNVDTLYGFHSFMSYQARHEWVARGSALGP
jgi:hypothetical protein